MTKHARKSRRLQAVERPPAATVVARIPAERPPGRRSSWLWLDLGHRRARQSQIPLVPENPGSNF